LSALALDKKGLESENTVEVTSHGVPNLTNGLHNLPFSGPKWCVKSDQQPPCGTGNANAGGIR